MAASPTLRERRFEVCSLQSSEITFHRSTVFFYKVYIGLASELLTSIASKFIGEKGPPLVTYSDAKLSSIYRRIVLRPKKKKHYIQCYFLHTELHRSKHNSICIIHPSHELK